jgi:hypothetical protein
VLHRISAAVVVAAGAMLISGAVPAFAASGGAQQFAIPGVYGISAWGSYLRMGATVRVTVCVRDTARDVYGGAAAAAASQGAHHQAVAAITIGFQRTQCRTMVTRYTAHLAVDALSGYRDGRIRQMGRFREIY